MPEHSPPGEAAGSGQALVFPRICGLGRQQPIARPIGLHRFLEFLGWPECKEFRTTATDCTHDSETRGHKGTRTRRPSAIYYANSDSSNTDQSDASLLCLCLEALRAMTQERVEVWGSRPHTSEAPYNLPDILASAGG